MAPVLPDPFLDAGGATFAAATPFGEHGWIYYALSALFFVLWGVACGYFIWRKGHMQTLDAEFEVDRTGRELDALRTDLGREEEVLRDDEAAVLDHILAAARECREEENPG